MNETAFLVRAREIRAGDFLDTVEPALLRGPRGGRYRWAGVTVQSRVVSAAWVDSSEHARGFKIVPTTGPAFVLPGNSADIVDARVRRSAETEMMGGWQSDEDLLAALESPVRAVALAAAAELEQRTGPSRRVRS